MRTLVVSLFLITASWAQTPAPPPPSGTPAPAPAPPAMPATAPTTPPAAAITPDTVVAEVDGKKYTAGEVDSLLKTFPAQMQAQVHGDLKRALGFALLMRYLSDEALKANLQNESPLKETLEYQRTNALAQAEVNQIRNLGIKISPADEQKEYKDHPDQFREAKVKAIYIAFASITPKNQPAEKKTLTESEAKAKIEDLKKQIDAGTDFSKLAKENSDDKQSAAKDGDFGLIKNDSPYPEAIKNAIFSLNPGQVSDPIRQPNGFYLVKVDDIHLLPFDQVENHIHEQLRQKEFNEYMQNIQKRFEVKVENPAFFAVKPQAPQTR